MDFKIGFRFKMAVAVHIFYFFFLKYGCDYCIYMWCKDNFKNSGGKMVFLRGGSMEPPYALTEVRVPYAVKC